MKKMQERRGYRRNGSACVYGSGICFKPGYLGLLFLVFQVSLLIAQPPSFARTGFGKGNYNLLPDTGQTGCVDENGTTIACPGTGQDGDWTGLPRSFSVQDPAGNGENVVLDNNTGLMWMRGTADINGDGVIDNSDIRTQSEAVLYCNTLSYAEFEDWRLPQIFELTTIADYNAYKPAFSPAIFYAESWAPSGVNPAKYWSATSRGGNTNDMAWFMDYEYGRISSYYNNVSYYVRCVRNGIEPSDAGFIDNGDETVTDPQTGLVWAKAAAQDKQTWQDALGYCNTLYLAGQDDWRLPNIQELRSILRLSTGDDGIDTSVFSGALDDPYWASTSFDASPSQAWAVAFNGNGDGWYTKNSTFNVRCVRSGLGGPYHILAMSILGNGTGHVMSNPAGIDCNTGECSGPFQSQPFQEDTSVTLSATAAANSAFTGWGDDCSACGTSDECPVVMDDSKQCTATFTSTDEYTLTISPVPNHGTITANTNISASSKSRPSKGVIISYITITDPPGLTCGSGGTDCTETYDAGTLVRLTASADEGYLFSEWEGDCKGCGPSETCSITMDVDKTCTAVINQRNGSGDSGGRFFVIKAKNGKAIILPLHGSRGPTQ